MHCEPSAPAAFRLLNVFRLVLVLALCLTTRMVAAGPVLTTYSLGAGWATFGIVLPQGAASAGLKIGSLPTQTNVKRTWPDGSIRFAVVSAQIPSAGSYPISSDTIAAGSVAVTPPAASVRLTIGGQAWVATLPGAHTADVWLAGPLVRESRSVVTPVAGGVSHPTLRVIFDLRSYAGGGHRLDVTVENVLNVPETNLVTYDVAVVLGGAQVFAKSGVPHASFARWRKHFWSSGASEAAVTPDFSTLHAARAIPEYLPNIQSPSRSTSGANFDLMKIGDLMYPMGNAGARPEIGLYPGWAAEYLVHRRADQRDYVLRHGDVAAGAWSTHYREVDGTMVSLATKPDFFLPWYQGSPYNDGVKGPANDSRGITYPGENGAAHMPSLAYVPYLLTGDRFYLDEMKFWTSYAIMGWLWERRGVQGLVGEQEIRGIAWAVRHMADLVAYMPDADADRTYYTGILDDNLTLLRARPAVDIDPLGGNYHGRGSNLAHGMKPWMTSYLVVSLNHVAQQGFLTAEPMLDRLLSYHVNMFNAHPGFDRRGAFAYEFHGKRIDGTPFTSFADMWTYNFTGSSPRAVLEKIIGYYGVNMRTILVISTARGIQGADTALAWLEAYQPGPGEGWPMSVEVTIRPEYAFTVAGAGIGATSGSPSSPPPSPTPPTQTTSPPAPPTNVRIVR